MHVHILYFASLREERGLDQETHTLTTAITISDLFVQIFSRPPEGMRFAVNQLYVSAETMLKDGDEVAFIPPLGGG